MNNFEIWDNAFQILALLCAMALSGMTGIHWQSRRAVVLACWYASFMLGTLFYTLHITIIGDIPRIFYVADISWLAAYLFLLLLMTLRADVEKNGVPFNGPAAGCAALTCAAAMYNEIFGPSKLMSCAFGLFAAGIVYLAVLKILECRKSAEPVPKFDIIAVIVIFLQIFLYFVSVYISDYTRFNLYFAVDILLTLHMVSLTYFLRKEVKQDDAY